MPAFCFLRILRHKASTTQVIKSLIFFFLYQCFWELQTYSRKMSSDFFSFLFYISKFRLYWAEPLLHLELSVQSLGLILPSQNSWSSTEYQQQKKKKKKEFWLWDKILSEFLYNFFYYSKQNILNYCICSLGLKKMRGESFIIDWNHFFSTQIGQRSNSNGCFIPYHCRFLCNSDQ